MSSSSEGAAPGALDLTKKCKNGQSFDCGILKSALYFENVCVVTYLSNVSTLSHLAALLQFNRPVMHFLESIWHLQQSVMPLMPLYPDRLVSDSF